MGSRTATSGYGTLPNSVEICTIRTAWVATERETFVARDVNVHHIFALRCAPEAKR